MSLQNDDWNDMVDETDDVVDQQEEEDCKKSKNILEHVDGGNHITNARFQTDFKQVLEFAIKQGVTEMICFTDQMGKIHKNLNQCMAFPGRLYTTIGIHPHFTSRRYLSDLQQTLTEMKQLIRKHSALIKAIGPVGLDYEVLSHSSSSPQKNQFAAFEAQVKLACDLKIPLIVQERSAHYDVVRVLSKYKSRLPRTLIHCFSGSRQQLEQFIDLGCYIGVTGFVTTSHGEEFRNSVHQIPLTRIICESNAPFSVPYGASYLLSNTRRNEPAVLGKIVQALHESYCFHKKSEDQDFVSPTLAQFANEIRKNTRAFYSLV